MSPLRRVISTRLVEAQRTAAILTTFNEVDLDALLALRGRQATLPLSGKQIRNGRTRVRPSPTVWAGGVEFSTLSLCSACRGCRG
jgi:pyruvate/2-oxoglutarate dehydrogenase complex dihydrolipoamide acyltransferase (E2) component